MGFEFLLLVGLGAWVFVQSRRIGALSREIDALKHDLGALKSARPHTSAAEPMQQPANETLPELLLTQVVEEPPSAPKPELVAPPPKEAEQPELLLTQVAPPPAMVPTTPARPAKPREKKPSRSIEQWLSENGLAWIAGGAIALGGVFLVGWAAQQSFFAPTVRLFTALALGLALIGAAEYVRHVAKTRPFGHPLAAALLAGAGASTLYVTAWGAYGIYNYISWPLAAAALTACALILLALSFRHGQALGVLAIGAALLAPLLSSAEAWPPLALALYTSAVGVGGFVVAGLRRWSWLAAATTLGAYAWFALSLQQGALFRGLTMLYLVGIGGWSLGFRAPLEEKDDVTMPWRGVQTWLPSLALGLSALFAALSWNVAALTAPSSIAGPAMVGMFLAGLTAFAVRAGVARPAALAAAIGSLALGVFSFARNVMTSRGEEQLYVWALLCACAAGLAALAAAPRSRERGMLAGFGAIGAFAILVIAAITRAVWSAPEVWAMLAVGGALLAGGAYFLGRSATDTTKDISVDLWAGAGAAAILLALESLAPIDMKPAADAGAALLFAGVKLQRGWRVAGSAAVTAAAIGLAHAFSPSFTGTAWDGTLDIWRAAIVLALAAAGAYGAAWVLRRREAAAQTAEALDAAAILTLLLGAFLLLHAFAAGPGALDAFTEQALRALMLTSAGYVAMPRGTRPAGWVARWRGHALMIAGLGVGALMAGLALNPWWGAAPAAIDGAPLFNMQAIAFAAPAALAFLTANRLYTRALLPARLYAGVGALFAVSWIALELRRGFHGPDMAVGAIGLVEGDCYGLAALVGACAAAYLAKRRAGMAGARPFTHDLIRMIGATAIAGVLIGAFFLLFARNAWWGAQAAATTDAGATALGVLAQAPAAALALFLGLSLPKHAHNASFVAASAVNLFTLSFGALIIRWAYHQGAMDDWQPLIGVEGMLYTIWPLALVGGGIVLTQRLAKCRDAHELSHDLNALWSVGAWPALIFAGFGLWAMFNPWRGMWPPQTPDFVDALAALLIFLAAAALSISVSRLRIIARDPLFPKAAKIAAIIHLFAVSMLIVRRLYHGPDIGPYAQETNLETWTYSAAWVVFGAGVWGLGVRRRDALVRWAGLILLLTVSVKVFVFDMRQLSFVVRAASFLGLGGVLMLVALAARRFGPQTTSATRN